MRFGKPIHLQGAKHSIRIGDTPDGRVVQATLREEHDLNTGNPVLAAYRAIPRGWKVDRNRCTTFIDNRTYQLPIRRVAR